MRQMVAMPGLEIPGEFLRHAVLDTVVPHAPGLDIEGALSSALENGADDVPSALSSIPQRSLLFYDEFLPVRIVLRLSDCSETTLKHYLPRLEVKLDVFAVDPAESVGENLTPTREIIFSGIVSGDEDPIVVFNEFEGDEGAGNHIYLVWNIDTVLKRPRIRIQHPSLLFIASASLNPSDGRHQDDSEDDYLPSLIPASTNMLQPLSSDKSFNQKEPFLPASRLLRVVPTTYDEEPIYNIQQQHGKPFRVVPAASTRIRYSRLNSYTGIPMTAALLDFEVTPYLSCEVSFTMADVQLSEGTIESMSDTPGLALPIVCRPRDGVTLMYRLTPEYGPETNPSSTALLSTLDISLEATILVDEECQPRISMQWKTHVDFSVALNPTYGSPSPALQRTNRPTSLSMSAQLGANTSTRSSLRERAYSITDLGVTISFSGPVRVQVGSAFSWGVFIVNRSNVPRKFALVAIPRRKRIDPRGHVARPSSSSIASRKEDQVAEAVTDDNIVHARRKSVAGQEVELISLSTEIRVGPLLPGTCHSTEIKLLPLATGSLHLDAVRLIDVNTNETTDIRDLPDVLADDQPRS